MTDRVWPPTRGCYVYRKLIRRLPNGRWERGPKEPCRIWLGPPLDPQTGDELDRSHVWNAMVSAQPRDIDEIWPFVAGDKITDEEYDDMLRQLMEGLENV